MSQFSFLSGDIIVDDVISVLILMLQISKSNPSKMHNIGRFENTKLEFDDGILRLNYLHGNFFLIFLSWSLSSGCWGDACGSNGTFSTQMTFICHHQSNFVPIYTQTTGCRYEFKWHTPLACPPIKTVSCSARYCDPGLPFLDHYLHRNNKGQTFDLSRLSSTSTNYIASTIEDVNGRDYYINVCRTLLNQPHVTCPPNSAACFKEVIGTKTRSVVHIFKVWSF